VFLSLVVAVADNGVIGRDNALPWHLPADLRQFRRITMGHPLLMGRRTHEAIGRPLDGRHNIVLSRDPCFRAPGCTVVESLEAAMEAARPAAELMVIGGETLYRQTLPLAERIYLTEVHARPEGGARFPALDEAQWLTQEREERPADQHNPYACTFRRLQRRQQAAPAIPPRS
jgi:dihydrofolate reductase